MHWSRVLKILEGYISFVPNTVPRTLHVSSQLFLKIILVNLIKVQTRPNKVVIFLWDHIVCVSSVQLLSHVRLFATPWIAALQASLSITNSRSLFKLMSIELVMPSSHLILCRPLLLLPPIPPIIRVFSNESTLRMRWPEYWSFSFSISPSNEHPGLISALLLTNFGSMDDLLLPPLYLNFFIKCGN